MTDGPMLHDQAGLGFGTFHRARHAIREFGGETGPLLLRVGPRNERIAREIASAHADVTVEVNHHVEGDDWTLTVRETAHEAQGRP